MTISKILLIKLSNASLYKTKNLTMLEPLGLEYIASAINERHEVRMMDMDYQTKPEVVSMLHDFDPDFVGTTVSTPMVLEARELMTIVSLVCPNAKRIIGGGHPSALPEQALKDTGADIAIVGEGESIINDILDNNTLFYTDDTWTYWGEALPIDSIKPPRRDLLDRKFYKSSYDFEDKVGIKCASVITSRGCPFPCNYCASKTILGKKVRFRDPKLVADEIEDLIYKQGVGAILFLDDCFTLNEIKVIELCEQIINRGMDFYWWLDTRVDCISEGVLNLMYEAGCRFIVYGVEAGSQAVLDRIGKKIKVDQIKEAFEVTQRVGIDTKANFMLGHIDETYEEIEESISLAKSLNATRYGFYLTLPLPGSKLYEIAKVRDVITKGFDRFKWYDEPVSNISKVSAEDLLLLQKEAYKECEFIK